MIVSVKEIKRKGKKENPEIIQEMKGGVKEITIKLGIPEKNIYMALWRGSQKIKNKEGKQFIIEKEKEKEEIKFKFPLTTFKYIKENLEDGIDIEICCYLLNIMFYRNKHWTQSSDNKEVTLSRVLLEKIGTSKYAKYRAFFKEKGIIIEVEKPGIHHAGKYKLNDALLIPDMIELVIKNKFIVKKYLEYKQWFVSTVENEKLEKLYATDNFPPQLNKIITDIQNNFKKIHINDEIRREIINEMYKSNDVKKQFHAHHIDDTDIFKNFIKFTTCDKHGWRVHHSASNIRKEFRKCLESHEGEKLVSIDLKNSQPFLFACLYNKEFNKKIGEYFDITDRNIIQNTLSDVNKYSDIKVFIEKTQKGEIYNHSEISREVMKNEIMYSFFKKENTKYKSEMEKILQKEYPTIENDIQKMKNKFKKNKKTKLMGENGNQRFNSLLQRIESLIFIQSLIPQLINLNIPFVPIHDSVLVPESMQYIVIECLNNSFKLFGIDYNAPLKIEKL